MDKLVIILTNADPRVMSDVAFPYANAAIEKGWISEIVILLWGPPERTVISTLELKAAVMDLVEKEHIQVWACQVCSEDYHISDRLEDLGITVKPIGEALTNMLKEGWLQLSF